MKRGWEAPALSREGKLQLETFVSPSVKKDHISSFVIFQKPFVLPHSNRQSIEESNPLRHRNLALIEKGSPRNHLCHFIDFTSG
jgi:hypothetical protein